MYYVGLFCRYVDHRCISDMQSAAAHVCASFHKRKYVRLFCRCVGLFCRYVDHRRISDMQSAAARCISTDPRAEEIRLQIITTAQNSNKLLPESPYTSNTFLREFPGFHTRFHERKRSPRHSKDLPGNQVDLEIQIFSV